MKSILRNTLVNAFALSVLPLLFTGVSIAGGLPTFILGGFVLSVVSTVLKPILNILALPLNFITFGAASFLVNALLFYLVTSLVPQISIRAFVFPGFSLVGFVVPSISFNIFFAYIVTAFTLSVIVSFIQWLIKK